MALYLNSNRWQQLFDFMTNNPEHTTTLIFNEFMIFPTVFLTEIKSIAGQSVKISKTKSNILSRREPEDFVFPNELLPVQHQKLFWPYEKKLKINDPSYHKQWFQSSSVGNAVRLCSNQTFYGLNWRDLFINLISQIQDSNAGFLSNTQSETGFKDVSQLRPLT